MNIEYKKVSGIYKIQSIATGRLYVGSAHCLYTRHHVHLSQLKSATHCNKHLQRIYNKHGQSDLRFSVLEICEKGVLISREQHYMDTLKPGINIDPLAQSSAGRKATMEQRRKMSAARIGVQSTAMLGKKHSEHTKRLISEKAKQRGLHPAFMAASKAANTGRKHTKEMRDLLALSQRKITPEAAAQIKEARSKGEYQKDLARQYGVSQRLIVRVEKRIGIYGSPIYD